MFLECKLSNKFIVPFNVDSSFIQAFEELATEHYPLYSSSSEFDSLLAEANTKNSFTLINLVYLPNEQTHKRFHIWWVSLEHTYHWKFNSSFRYHIVSENSFLCCRKICVANLFWHCNRIALFKKYTRRTVK